MNLFLNWAQCGGRDSSSGALDTCSNLQMNKFATARAEVKWTFQSFIHLEMNK